MAGYGGPPQGGPYGAPQAYGAPPPQPYQQQPPPQQFGHPQHPPQHGQMPHQGAPPGQDPLWGYFSSVAGPDQQISPAELQQALTSTGMASYPRPGSEFSMETCRLMISMLDANKSGTMGFAEFKQLMSALEMWKSTFQSVDADRSGAIERGELKGAIAKFGYNLSDTTIDVLMRRYGKHSAHQIQFDDFVALAVRIRALSEKFKQRDTQGTGYAQFHYDEFIAICMSC
eukprot:TRINITY_DN10565_c0_g1_i2.p1 TRINITY_DN10565_c0_g1~~TRINITY_DN10565_c0_g1_i2.p1  ORF type:complete len:229 (+),score=40.38 TRINITY_DN10565_c0_g1_i2:169-855(+)